MSILTAEQKQAYMKNPLACPFCGSPDINAGSFGADHVFVWQNITCDKCNENWRDVYKLAFVETDDE